MNCLGKGGKLVDVVGAGGAVQERRVGQHAQSGRLAAGCGGVIPVRHLCGVNLIRL
jgi:hypothetical protein